MVKVFLETNVEPMSLFRQHVVHHKFEELLIAIEQSVERFEQLWKLGRDRKRHRNSRTVCDHDQILLAHTLDVALVAKRLQ